jgi:hypothetical protein
MALIITTSAIHYAAIAIAVQGVQALPWQRMPQHAETVAIDTYIVETLMRDLVGHDRQPSAYLVYLFLWHETHGRKKPTTQLALIDIAENVGLSKRGVQDALGHLGRRKLIAVARESITAVPVYTVLRPWRR